MNICSVNVQRVRMLSLRFLLMFDKHYKNLSQEQLSDVSFAKTNLPFAGDLYMGHLRYSTTGKSGLSYVHPSCVVTIGRLRTSVCVATFNMTNIEDVFEILTEQRTVSTHL